MAVWKTRSKRLSTGALRHATRLHRRSERGREFLAPTIGKPDRKAVRTLGGGVKTAIARIDVAMVSDPKTGKTTPSKILTVVENPANPHYARRNILTKGTIIKTDAGQARITSRPGQDGTVQAILIKQ